jgi:cytochrome c556
MLRIVAAVAAVAIGATIVQAQNMDVIKARKEAMKAQGAAAGVGAKMMKGEEPFSLEKAQGALKTYADESMKFKGLFPDDSKTGGETQALPKIWEAKADFAAKADKLVADAKAAQTAIKDEASFKTEWPKVMSNCGGCHKEYRQPPKQ